MAEAAAAAHCASCSKNQEKCRKSQQTMAAVSIVLSLLQVGLLLTIMAGASSFLKPAVPGVLPLDLSQEVPLANATHLCLPKEVSELVPMLMMFTSLNLAFIIFLLTVMAFGHSLEDTSFVISFLCCASNALLWLVLGVVRGGGGYEHQEAVWWLAIPMGVLAVLNCIQIPLLCLQPAPRGSVSQGCLTLGKHDWTWCSGILILGFVKVCVLMCLLNEMFNQIFKKESFPLEDNNNSEDDSVTSPVTLLCMASTMSGRSFLLPVLSYAGVSMGFTVVTTVLTLTIDGNDSAPFGASSALLRMDAVVWGVVYAAAYTIAQPYMPSSDVYVYIPRMMICLAGIAWMQHVAVRELPRLYKDMQDAAKQASATKSDSSSVTSGTASTSADEPAVTTVDTTAHPDVAACDLSDPVDPPSQVDEMITPISVDQVMAALLPFLADSSTRDLALALLSTYKPNTQRTVLANALFAPQPTMTKDANNSSVPPSTDSATISTTNSNGSNNSSSNNADNSNSDMVVNNTSSSSSTTEITTDAKLDVAGASAAPAAAPTSTTSGSELHATDMARTSTAEDDTWSEVNITLS